MRDGTITIDKPRFTTESANLGAVDVKINHLGNRVAVSSLDYALQIYNLHPESGLTFYKDIQQ